MSVLGSIAGGLFSVGTKLNSSEVQRSENAKQREYEQKMYEKQKADNIAQWERQNQYDSPAEQMKRLKAAGLNPNLIYGQMGTGNVAQNVATPQVSDLSGNMASANNAAASMVGAGAGVFNAVTQARLAEAQIHLTNAEATKTEHETPGADYGQKLGEFTIYNLSAKNKNLDSQTVLNNLEAKYADETYSAKIENLHASSDALLAAGLQSRSNTIANSLQSMLLEKEYEYYDRTALARITQMENAAKLSDRQSQVEEINKQVKQAEEELLNAEQELTRNKSKLTKGQTLTEAGRTAINEYNARLTEYQAAVAYKDYYYYEDNHRWNPRNAFRPSAETKYKTYSTMGKTKEQASAAANYLHHLTDLARENANSVK